MVAQLRNCARLQLFGPLRLFAVDGSDVTPRGQKARGLLALLALTRDGRLARIAAATRLWSGSHDAKANLRQCLCELRRALDAAEPGLFRTDDDELVLDHRRLAIDALALEAAADASSLEPFDDDCILRDIEIADPLFEEWLAPERVRWRDRLHQRVEACARARLAADDPTGAIALAARLVAFEPTLEAAHRILMQGHAAQGNGSLALRQFELCRETLASELGVAPSEATLALRAAIARPPRREPRPEPARQAAAWCAAATKLAPAHAGRFAQAIPPAAPIPVGLASFRVLSEETGDSLYAVILGEAIGAALARSIDLAVIDEARPAHATTARDECIAAVAPPVAYAVDGSVARLDTSLRLTVRLVRAADRRLLWAEHFRIESPCDDATLDGLTELIADRLERAVLWHDEQGAEPTKGAAASTHGRDQAVLVPHGEAIAGEQHQRPNANQGA